MARAKTTTASSASSASSKALVNVDAQLAAEAAQFKNQLGASSSNRLKVEVRGSFSTPDGMDLGNEIQLIVLDFASRNQYYTVPFSADNPAAPECYAMGRSIPDLAPEDDSPTKIHSDCASCPMNAFGSAPTGRGKACQNRRQVAVLLVDPDNPDAHNAPDAPIYLLDLSPSNLKSFDGAMKHVTTMLGHPLKAIITATATNAGTYAVVTFGTPEPNPDYELHVSRRGECEEILFRRPDFARAAAAANSKPARGRAAPPAARGRR